MLRFLLPSVSALALLAQPAVAATPNVLIIMADDCTYNDLPVYGGAKTRSHPDTSTSLAADGLTFERAYLCRGDVPALPRRALHRPLSDAQRLRLEPLRQPARRQKRSPTISRRAAGLPGGDRRARSTSSPPAAFPFEKVEQASIRVACASPDPGATTWPGRSGNSWRRRKRGLLPGRRPGRAACPLGDGRRLAVPSRRRSSCRRTSPTRR